MMSPNGFALMVVVAALSIYGMIVGPAPWPSAGAIGLGIAFRFGYFFAVGK